MNQQTLKRLQKLQKKRNLAPSSYLAVEFCPDGSGEVFIETFHSCGNDRKEVVFYFDNKADFDTMLVAELRKK